MNTINRDFFRYSQKRQEMTDTVAFMVRANALCPTTINLSGACQRVRELHQEIRNLEKKLG